MRGIALPLALACLVATPAATTAAPKRGKIAAASHLVERVLPGDSSKALPVHPGGAITLRLARPAISVGASESPTRGRTERSIPARRVGPTRRRFRIRLPRAGGVPQRLAIRVRTTQGTRRFTLRLRRHRHRPIREVPAGGDIVDVFWAYRPRTFAEMARRAGAAAEVRVDAAAPGPSLGSPESPIRTERITLRVRRVWFGRLPRTFRLFKTGSEDSWANGDPRYETGEQYVVYTSKERFRDGSYLPVAPDGRLIIDRSKLLRPFIAGPVPRALDGLTPEEARSATRAARD